MSDDEGGDDYGDYEDIGEGDLGDDDTVAGLPEEAEPEGTEPDEGLDEGAAGTDSDGSGDEGEGEADEEPEPIEAGPRGGMARPVLPGVPPPEQPPSPPAGQGLQHPTASRSESL